MPDNANALILAAQHADWMTVVLNQGPPCFRVEQDGHFCFRAERWAGHGTDPGDIHPFVSLADLLAPLHARVAEAVADEPRDAAREQAARAQAALLRRALVGLVGVDTREELDAMEAVFRGANIPAADRAATIDAIDALRQTHADRKETPHA